MDLRHVIRLTLLLIAIANLSVSIATADQGDGDSPSFNAQIRPILANQCFACHGPDEEDRQGDLRLDVAGEIDLEEIIARVTSDDADLVMPPPKTNKRLNASQIKLLESWIKAGAPYEEHWSFVPPKRETPPVALSSSSSPTDRGVTMIDRFVIAKLQSQGLRQTENADKRTLIRRLSLDLTGLPPSREQIRRFIEDSSPRAYERLVNRLLDSPHYGEHMARYWLDLVRFADTNGLHHDHYREMTPYRDWVIRAFNQNLPFDQFIIAQIAGDLYEQPSDDQLIASGFNRLHLIIDRGTALPEESFTRNVVDRVSSVGTAFLGLTLECAVCHDHKYDPITQRDFYQLFAFFNNFDGGPETGGRRGLDFERGLQPPYLELPSPTQAELRKQLDREIKELQAKQKKLEKTGEESAKQELAGIAKKLTELNQQRDDLIRSIPATLIMKEREEIRPAHLLVRGNYDQHGELVSRNTPAALPPLQFDNEIPTRMDLAHWLTSETNPLTARVAVNRFWQHLFGVGLVKSSEDFGAQGEPPSHPGLLDYLTIQFTSSNWDVKSLLREIVLSKTYRQSSVTSREAYLTDPENRLLARGSRYRLDAEVIRDQVLACSGLLNPTLYGKSVKPPQPDGLWEIVAMPFSYPRVFKADAGDAIYRRSVYSFWKRALPPPQMTIFDAPTRESCIARRERTNTPLQALVLMNEQQYFVAAMKLAEGLLDHQELDDQQRIELAYETITSRRPDGGTVGRLNKALSQFRELYQDDVEARQKMMSIDAPAADLVQPTPQQQTELAAMTMLVHSLLNLDVTKTRE